MHLDSPNQFKTASQRMLIIQNASQERRRRRAGKQLSKRVFWRVCFFSPPLRFPLKTPENLKGRRRNGLSKNNLLDPFA